jgi:hypothetical protein
MRSKQLAAVHQPLVIVVFIGALFHLSRYRRGATYSVDLHFPEQRLPSLLTKIAAGRKILDVLLSGADDTIDDLDAALHDLGSLAGGALSEIIVPQQHQHLVGVDQLPGHKCHFA